MSEKNVLPQGWKSAKLGEICDIQTGKKDVNEGDPKGEYRFYTCASKPTRSNEYSFEGESILLPGNGANVGMAFYFNGKFEAYQRTYVLNNFSVAGKYVLYYFLGFWKGHVQGKQYGSATNYIRLGNLTSFIVPIPPLPKQERIVAKIEELFTQLDAGVAELEQAKAQLKRYRQSVLKSAVEGELTREWRESRLGELEPASQLLGRVLAERRVKWEEEQLEKFRAKGKEPKNDKWKEKYKEPVAPETDGLLELPDGWVWASTEQISDHEPNSITDGPFGSKLKTAHYTDAGPRVIRLQNIGDGVFYDEKAHISEEHFETLRKHEIFAGDLVIGALGETLPRACIIPEYVGKAIVKADCMRFKPHPELGDTQYLNAALNSQVLKKNAKNTIHGIGRPRLNQGEVKALQIPMPTLEEQKVIAAEVERRLSVADAIEKELDQALVRAERLRQSVLKSAFEGRLV